MQTNWSADETVLRAQPRRRAPADIARRALRHAPIIILLALAAAAAVVFGMRFAPATYRSSAVLAITPRNALAGSSVTEDVASRSALVDAEVGRLNDPAFAKRIATELARQQAAAKPAAGSKAPAGILAPNSVWASRRDDSYIVDINARGASPAEAKAFADAALDAYEFARLDWRSTAAAPAPKPAVETPAVAEARVQLAALEASRPPIAADAARAASAPPPVQATENADVLKARSELANARKGVAALSALLRSEVGFDDVSRLKASGVLDQPGEIADALRAEVSAYDLKASQGGNPEDAKYRILTQASRLSDALQGDVSRLAAKAGQASATPAQAAAAQAPAAVLRLQTLDAQIEQQKRVLEAAAKSQAATSEAAPVMDVRVVSRAGLGVPPVWSRPLSVYGLAGLAGVLVGLAYLIFLALSSNTVVDEQDAVALVGAPLAAAVPKIPASRLRRLPPSERQPSNFGIENPASSFSAAMRDVLVRVMPTAANSTETAVVVAGAQSGDGATAVALSLGRTAASQGLRVLLIDADFDEAGLTHAMGINPAAGLDAIMDGQRALADLLVEDDVSSAHLLPSAPVKGKDGALSLSQIEALKGAIASAKMHYDLIIIDSQPHAASTRSRSISRLADAAVIVATYGVTKRAPLAALARRVQQNGAAIRGVVFNQAPERPVRSSKLEFVARQAPEEISGTIFPESAIGDVVRFRTVR